MSDNIVRALDIGSEPDIRERTIDITTTGARTDAPRRIEIWFWQVDGNWYLASDTTPRAWYRNLRAHPRFTVHLKHGVHADLPATAVDVTDTDTRRHVLREILVQSPNRTPDPLVLEDWVRDSPLIRIEFDHLKQARPLA
ncbi:nitroreductase/quinone reductase family protein [Streptomyces sp. NPDC026672]|uniref:nitroreductase/quinone reductase family protein n=1 Tax=unclassified Streptomyces TaxID=2593676 RepID=UPI0033CA27F1